MDGGLGVKFRIRLQSTLCLWGGPCCCSFCCARKAPPPANGGGPHVGNGQQSLPDFGASAPPAKEGVQSASRAPETLSSKDQALQEAILFPSGKWKGYYVQLAEDKLCPEKHPLRVFLGAQKLIKTDPKTVPGPHLKESS